MPREKKIVDYNKLARERAYSPEAFARLYKRQAELAKKRNTKKKEDQKEYKNAWFRDWYYNRGGREKARELYRRKSKDPEWLKQHRERSKIACRKSYWKYHEARLAESREYHAAHAEEINERKRKRQQSLSEEQKQKHREKCRECREKNKDRLNAYARKRYAEKREELKAKARERYQKRKKGK